MKPFTVRERFAAWPRQDGSALIVVRDHNTGARAEVKLSADEVRKLIACFEGES